MENVTLFLSNLKQHTFTVHKKEKGILHLYQHLACPFLGTSPLIPQLFEDSGDPGFNYFWLLRGKNTFLVAKRRQTYFGTITASVKNYLLKFKNRWLFSGLGPKKMSSPLIEEAFLKLQNDAEPWETLCLHKVHRLGGDNIKSQVGYE